MSISKIRSALVTALISQNFVPQANIAFENFDFNIPTGGQAWLSFFFVPNQPQGATCGSYGTDEVTGFIQIDINTPTGIGEKTATDIFESIYSFFTQQHSFTYLGQEVTVRSVGRSQGTAKDLCYTIPVTIYFYAQIQRQP